MRLDSVTVILPQKVTVYQSRGTSLGAGNHVAPGYYPGDARNAHALSARGSTDFIAYAPSKWPGSGPSSGRGREKVRRFATGWFLPP
jgi:hypothetical protein